MTRGQLLEPQTQPTQNQTQPAQNEPELVENQSQPVAVVNPFPTTRFDEFIYFQMTKRKGYQKSVVVLTLTLKWNNGVWIFSEGYSFRVIAFIG